MKTQVLDLEENLNLISLSYSEQTSIEGGGEPGYAFGYYLEKSWEGIQAGWNELQKWRESNIEKYGPWIG